MAEKQPRGYFKLTDEELSCSEVVFTFFTMLESKGYHGFTELMSIVKDPATIFKIVRLMYGTNLKIPPLKEFVDILQATIYSYCDIHKRVNSYLPAKPADIRQFMNIDESREKELLDIFDNWVVYMNKNGHDIRGIFHINRNNTKKRIDMAVRGKKWKARKY